MMFEEWKDFEVERELDAQMGRSPNANNHPEYSSEDDSEFDTFMSPCEEF